MKDTENNKDSKKFTLKKLDYTENMVELMNVMTVLGVQIAKIETNPKAEVHNNLVNTITNIKNGLAQELTSYNKEKAKQIIEKRGIKFIKFDKQQDKTGLVRKFINSTLHELTDFDNLLGKNMQDSKGVENNSNIFTTFANKLTLGLVLKDSKVSKEINNHIKNIATISQDFANAAHPKERAFYLQQMNDELNKLVKSKDNDMKWDKSFKAYLTEFVESFQKFLTVTAPSLFKKQITEDKKWNIIDEAQQQLSVQQKEIFNGLTDKEKAAIQLTYSTRRPNNIGNIQDFEKDLLEYKQGVIKEEKTEKSKNFIQKGLDQVKAIGNSNEKSSKVGFSEIDLTSAQDKMNKYFELMRQKKQLANYVSTDATQQALNTAHSNNQQYQKEQSMLLHLLDETQQPLKDRTMKPVNQALDEPKSSDTAKNLIANLCKKIPPVEDAAVISDHKKQTGLSNQAPLQQQAALRQSTTPPTNRKTVGTNTAALNKRTNKNSGRGQS